MNPETSEYDRVGHAHETRADSSASIAVEKNVDLEDRDQIQEEEAKPVDVPPDGEYGWVYVACVFLINAHTWGVNSVSPFSGTTPDRNHTNNS